MLGQKMESEMREQPVLLLQNWPFYDEHLRQILKDERPELVLLAARGSSDNAALYARYLIEIYLQIPVVLAAPSVLTRYQSHPKYPRTLAIGISQSGAAPDVSEIIEDMREHGHTTLAITNTPGSRLAEAAEHSLFLELPKEEAVAATKTYSATLLACYALVRALGGDFDCPDLPDDAWIDECCAAAEHSVNAMIGADAIFTLARGIRFCSADESALKLMECALLPCLAYSMADFEHGPRALASGSSVAILYGSRPDTWDGLDFNLFTAPERKGTPEPSLPIWDAIFAQWLALHTSRRMGLNADHPVALKKVTETL
jgi:glucosamine--fructose-6-phosphate aminotransferase (isomerizing)